MRDGPVCRSKALSETFEIHGDRAQRRGWSFETV